MTRDRLAKRAAKKACTEAVAPIPLVPPAPPPCKKVHDDMSFEMLSQYANYLKSCPTLNADQMEAIEKYNDLVQV